MSSKHTNFVDKATDKTTNKADDTKTDENTSKVSIFAVIKESILLFATENQFNKETSTWWFLSTLGIFLLCQFILDLGPSTFPMALFATVTWGFAYGFALIVATTANNRYVKDIVLLYLTV